MHPASELAARLAAGLVAQQLSPQAAAHRFALARDVVTTAQGREPLRAALVVGSTALQRCSPRADIDVVLILDKATDRPAFDSLDVEDVHVEIERLTCAQALSLTAGDGWIWELRSAARLGCGLPVFDPAGFAARLRDSAAAQRPDPEAWESTLRDVYLGLTALGRQRTLRPDHGETLRSVVDSLTVLVLLANPRRYQKPKWALADLVHAGELALVELVLGSYAIHSDDEAAARGAIGHTKALVAALYPAIGLPAHEALLAMGHAPRFSEASYVSRTLDDAEDLAASGRRVEAQYVARLAARLAAALVCPLRDSGTALERLEGLAPHIAALYADAFADLPPPRREQLEAALEVAHRLLDAAPQQPSTVHAGDAA